MLRGSAGPDRGTEAGMKLCAGRTSDLSPVGTRISGWLAIPWGNAGPDWGAEAGMRLGAGRTSDIGPVGTGILG